MYKRTSIFFVILIISGTLFFATIKPAQAFFFNPFQNMIQGMLGSMERIILTLSRDIGMMSNRILMMSDRIGTMADRIIKTEERMLEAIKPLNHSKTDRLPKMIPMTIIILPKEGEFVSLDRPLKLHLSQKGNYILYISNQANMAHATNAFVKDHDTSAAWDRAKIFTSEENIYIAIKMIGQNYSNEYSNIVKLSLH
jgi:hypothetical protein